MYRRKIITSMLLSMAITGCSRPGDVSDMTITNETGQRVTVDIKAATTDGDVVVSERISLQPAAEKVYDEITDGEETTILVRVQDGPEVESSYSDSSYDDRNVWFIIHTDSIEVIKGSA